MMVSDNILTSDHGQARSLSTLYWLDIDVNLKDILRQQRMILTDQISNLSPFSPQCCILNGVGTVANAISFGERPATFSCFGVDVTAFVRTDENFEKAELNRMAKMIRSDVDMHSPRLKIYIPPKMLRHLVELYLRKKLSRLLCP